MPAICQPGSLPGGEHMQRRLDRATAVPPGERTADVAAFVESSQLISEAVRLLPFQSTGPGGIQHGLQGMMASNRRQVLLGFVRAARADAISAPMHPPTKPEAGRHLVVYDMYLHPEAVAPANNTAYAVECNGEMTRLPVPQLPHGGWQLSADVLRVYAEAAAITRVQGLDRKTWLLQRLLQCFQLNARLAEPNVSRRLDAQLAELAAGDFEGQSCNSGSGEASSGAEAGSGTEGTSGGGSTSGGPLLTAALLQRSLCCRINCIADALNCSMPPGTLCRQEQTAVLEAVVSANSTLLRLAPNDSLALSTAAHLVCAEIHLVGSMGSMPSSARTCRVHELYEEAWQIAQEQGNDLAMATAGLNWLANSANNVLSCMPASLEALAAAVPLALAALRRCKLLLPDPWIEPLQGVAQVAKAQMLPALHKQLAYHRQFSDSHQEGRTVDPATANTGGKSGGSKAAARAAAAQKELEHLEAIRSVAQAGFASRQAQKNLLDPLTRSLCSGCAQYAIGLRSCSGCKQARYCSRHCQVLHWKAEHKKACKSRVGQ